MVGAVATATTAAAGTGAGGGITATGCDRPTDGGGGTTATGCERAAGGLTVAIGPVDFTGLAAGTGWVGGLRGSFPDCDWVRGRSGTPSEAPGGGGGTAEGG